MSENKLKFFFKHEFNLLKYKYIEIPNSEMVESSSMDVDVASPAESVKQTSRIAGKQMVLEESDLAYEEEILHHPYSVKCWLR